MTVLFLMSIFYIIYGIFGLFGKINIPKKFKGYKWTKDYTKISGVSYLLLGFPWLILSIAFSLYNPGYGKMILFVILCSLPALIFSIYNEIKYLKMIKKN